MSARGAWQGCVKEGQVNGDGDVPDDAELLADARTDLTAPATGWQECEAWETDGPAVLMDSVTAGADLDVEHPTAEHSPNRHPPRFGPIPSGRWSVRAPADDTPG
ncbi:Imm21 family immunity protein [Streptomyces sp. NPDC007945]|uniref:Imm21 family immunity protein n=1 Tax=Streptomyces sp. NPDC007945 TaxID=3364797 RepID=UPI0036E5A629